MPHVARNTGMNKNNFSKTEALREKKARKNLAKKLRKAKNKK